MGRDSLLVFHVQLLGCVHAWGVARARQARVSLRNGPFRTIPDSLSSTVCERAAVNWNGSGRFYPGRFRYCFQPSAT
jgi:hypothetical protein